MKKQYIIIPAVLLAGVILLAMIVFAGEWADNQLDDYLHAYYKLDGGSGNVVDVRGLLNGTNYGADRGITGKLNDAFDFERTETDIVNISDIDLDNITVSAWIKLESDPDFDGIVCKHRDSSWCLDIDSATNRLRFRAKGGSICNLLGTTAFSTGTWYHVAGTFNGSTARVWVDGDNEANTNCTDGAMGKDNYDVVLGGQPDGYHFDGLIDEVGIWSEDLNKTQIEALYNSGNALAYGDPTEVSLNSPAADAISDLNTITYNCSVDSASSATVKNVSLWTNYSESFVRNTTHFFGSILLDDMDANNESNWNFTGDDCSRDYSGSRMKFASSTGTHCSMNSTYAFNGTDYLRGTVNFTVYSSGMGDGSTKDIYIGSTKILGKAEMADSTSYQIRERNSTQVDVYNESGNFKNVTFTDGTVLGETIRFFHEAVEAGGSFEIDEFYYGLESTTEETAFTNTILTDTLWNCQACYDDGSCVFGSANRTISSKIYINNEIFNSTSYETATETYTVNLTANTSLSNVYLNYNGTEYAATQSGELWSHTLHMDTTNHLGNNTIGWIFDYAGSNITSVNQSQNVSTINFTLCDATYTTPYLNFSFKDEDDSSDISASIPSSTFYYWMGSNVSNNKSLTYSTVVENSSFAFCFSPEDETVNVDTYLQYKGTNYPQRTYDPVSLSLTNETTNTTLYLLHADDGQYVTFQVINTAEQSLSGVEANATRSIGGEDTIVAQGTTGADGAITFWLSPDFSHSFAFSRSGYDMYTTDLIPTQTTYTLTLGAETTTVSSDYFRGITYTILPSDHLLYNDTTYSFNFTLNSTYWEISEFGFTLSSRNGSEIDSTSASTNGGTLNLNTDTGNHTRIIMEYYWVAEGNYTNSSVFWLVLSDEDLDFSIKNFFNRLVTYVTGGIFGSDYDSDTGTSFTLSLIIFLSIFTFVGIMGYKFGITSSATIGAIIFGLVALFDVQLGLIPNPINAVPYFPTIVMGLVMIIMIIREVQR